jgi:ribosome-associated protein
MKQQGVLRRHVAGVGVGNRWILLDFDTVVVHVFLGEAREFYALESLWADAERVQFVPAPVGLARHGSMRGL